MCRTCGLRKHVVLQPVGRVQNLRPLDSQCVSFHSHLYLFSFPIFIKHDILYVDTGHFGEKVVPRHFSFPPATLYTSSDKNGQYHCDRVRFKGADHEE